MRVLILTSYFLSGQTTHVYTLARELRRQGHSPLLVNGRFQGRHQDAYRRMLGEIPSVATLRYRPVMRFARHVQPSVVHAHSKSTFQLGRRLAGHLRIPYILTVHAMSLITPEHVPTFRSAQRIICPSPEIYEAMRPHSNRRALIPNGIDLRHFRPQDRTQSEHLRVLYLGRVDDGKRPGLVALGQALAERPNIKLAVAANKPIPSPGAAHLGWIPHPEELLPHYDVVIGTGRAVLEGMACGCAGIVLGVCLDGLVTPESAPAFWSHNFSGRTMGVHPTKEAVGAVFDQFTSDPLLLPSLQDWGRTYVKEHFDLAEITRQTAALYADERRRLGRPRPRRIS